MSRNVRTLRKGWCITTNSPDLQRECEFSNSSFEYSVFGREKAPTTEMPHLQGYVHFKRKVRFSTVQKLFPSSHITPADGTAAQNRVYCTKCADFVEFGECPRQVFEQNKERWADALAAARAGEIDNIEPGIQIKHYGTLNRIAQDARADIALPTLDWTSPPNLWIWGPTGTGKSTKARSMLTEPYLKMCNKWWDQYQNEEDVLIEDLGRTHDYLGDHLKIWADRYF